MSKLVEAFTSVFVVVVVVVCTVFNFSLADR